MRPIVAIHGVSAGGDADVTGYGATMQAAVARVCAGLCDPPRVVEALWASVAQGVVSIEEIEAAELALATAAHPALGLVAGLLQRLGASLATPIDYAADVVVYGRPDVRKLIGAHVRAVIAVNPGCILLGHSLGSVIAIDVITEMIRAGEMDGPPGHRPVEGLVTMGSPLGIDVPIVSGIGFRDRSRSLAAMALPPIGWLDYYDVDDPVVDGSLWGGAPPANLERLPGYKSLGVQSLRIDTGNAITSHVSYWGHEVPAAGLVALASKGAP